MRLDFSELNSATKKEEGMNLFEKILWRIKFLLLESWGKSMGVILLSVLSAKSRGAFALVYFLEKKDIVKIDREKNFLKYKDFIFYYEGNDEISFIIPDLVSVWSSRDKYFLKNFINNSAYYFEGPYEHSKVKIEEGDFVIDAGANIGIFSCLASRAVGSAGKVFSFEPIKKTRDILKKNVDFNKLVNVDILPLALGEKSGQIEIFLTESSGGSSGCVGGGCLAEISEEATLDYVVEKNNIKKVDFIKADIEGMERNLIKGAERTIKKFKPKLSICVYHLKDDPEIISGLVKSFVPEYNILMTGAKMYAWCDK